MAHPTCALQLLSRRAPLGGISFTDSDWAGAKMTRKSTSGVIVMHGTSSELRPPAPKGRGPEFRKGRIECVCPRPM